MYLVLSLKRLQQSWGENGNAHEVTVISPKQNTGVLNCVAHTLCTIGGQRG